MDRNTTKLPAGFKIGEDVYINFWDKVNLHGYIHAVHFTPDKVKYDIQIWGPMDQYTRIYNIDSAFVCKKPQSEELPE